MAVTTKALSLQVLPARYVAKGAPSFAKDPQLMSPGLLREPPTTRLTGYPTEINGGVPWLTLVIFLSSRNRSV